MADDKTTAAASPAATAQNEQRTATIRYIDRPDIDEVFADSVTGLLYDGQTLRMEFAVTRFDEIKPREHNMLGAEIAESVVVEEHLLDGHHRTAGEQRRPPERGAREAPAGSGPSSAPRSGWSSSSPHSPRARPVATRWSPPTATATPRRGASCSTG